jgi:hypothetical protein
MSGIFVNFPAILERPCASPCSRAVDTIAATLRNERGQSTTALSRFRHRHEAPFKTLFGRQPKPSRCRTYQFAGLINLDGRRHDVPLTRRSMMLRKLTFALAAAATLGTAALAPTAANATWWYGHGWHGGYKPYYSGWNYGYHPYGYKRFYGPRYSYGGYNGWRYGWHHY